MKKTTTFLQQFNKLHAQEGKLLNEAKHYIVENYEKITDWSELSLEIKNGNNIDNSNKLAEFTYTPFKNSTYLKKLSKHYNSFYVDYDVSDDSVKTITDVVLDETDGDLSITVNGLEWWWIDKQTVMLLTIYIQRALMPNLNL